MKTLYPDIQTIEITGQQQLESIISQYSNYDKNYVASAIRKEFRELNENNWSIFEDYSGNNFLGRLKQTSKFRQTIWEMNLGVAVHKQIKLKRAPGKGEPDIITNSFSIECACPEPQGVPEQILTPLGTKGAFFVSSVPQEEIKQRITSAFIEKHKQYRRRKKSLKWQNKEYKLQPYIIAISLADMGNHSTESTSGLNLVEDVLMSLGNYQIVINRSNQKVISEGVTTQYEVVKQNNKKIPIGYFQKKWFAGVSAVIWSSKDYPEDYDIYVIHNPLASNPLNPELLSNFNHVKYIDNGVSWTRVKI